VWISALEANYVPVRLNVDYFQATARQYGITALPTTLILAPTTQGEVLDTIRGRLPPDQYIGRLNQVAADVKRRNTAVYAQIPGAPAGGPPAASALPPGAAPEQVAAPPSGSSSQPAGATAQAAAPVAGPSSLPAGPSTPAATGSPMAGSGAAAATPGSAPAAAVPPPIGLDGFCPVQLAEKSVWSPGNRRWGAIHRGRTYLFAGADEQRRFLADPDRYAPVNSGDDVVLTLEQNRSVPGTRIHGVSYGGRVYLFADEASLDKFSKNPKYYAERATQPAGSAMSGGPQVR
jgi:protein disulfide-isomerase